MADFEILFPQPKSGAWRVPDAPRATLVAAFLWLTPVPTGLAAAATPAEGPRLTGNLTLASDYVFRGLSQTREEPALQAQLGLAWRNNLGVTIWASNVALDGGEELEVDLILRWSPRINETLSLKIGGTRFLYIDESRSHYTEVYLGLIYRNSLQATYHHTADSAPGIGDDYVALDLDTALPDAFELSLHTGYTFFDGSERGVADFMLKLGRSFGRFHLGLELWDTDLEDEPLADEKVVLSVGLDSSRTYQIERYVQRIRNQVISLAEDRMMVDAVRAFRETFNELEATVAIDADWQIKLATFYREVWLPELAKKIGDEQKPTGGGFRQQPGDRAL